MKLYIWNGVLTDWSDGIAFAMAESLDEAHKVLLRGYHGDDCDVDGIMSGDVVSCLWNEIQFKEPEVHESPYGFAMYGGA